MNKKEQPESHKAENLERKECLEFLEKIKNHFLENFPFLNDEDRNRFVDLLDKTLEGGAKSGDDEREVEHQDRVSNEVVNADDFIKRIRQALVTLDNSHVNLIEKNIKKFKLDKDIYYKAGTFWIDISGEPHEILSIDDKPIAVAIEEKKMEIGGGTDEWKTYKATNALMSSPSESRIVIKARNKDGEEVEVDGNFIKNETEAGKTKMINGQVVELNIGDFVASEMLEDNIGYIAINSWSNKISSAGKNIAELVEGEMKKIKNSKAIIFDVRENDGGDSHLAHLVAGHFLKEKTPCSHFLIKKPENRDMIRHDGYVIPNGEYYDQKVVILTSPKCISSTDMFLTFLKDTGRAITIGQTTGGGSGNPQTLEIKLGDREFTLWVSCWRNYRNNGMEIENNGIEPDIFVEPTPDDVRNHIDRELEEAVIYVNNSYVS